MQQTFSITRKELDGYFSSLMALIFVGVFLAATLFTFFWLDGFWGRGLADVRPLFRRMPLLLVFLAGALTMRQWSEEQQTGTLEVLLTMPVRIAQLVLGKFAGVLLLVMVALALTLFLPLSVSALGNLDWGPVVGGYLAAVLMASAYIAIGLFLSSRTDNQIVALILTVIVCGLLHFIGTSAFTDLFGSAEIADLLRGLSTSARFQSIERGVIDLRDLLYYLSLTVGFLALNVLSLDAKRWSQGDLTARYRFNRLLGGALVVLNLTALNIIASPFTARLDLTSDQRYSLSPVTKDLLNNLQEPLLIRGYFSEENHPLLAPLIPQIRDTLAEYQAVAGDNLQVEIIDPLDNPDLEAEANQVYGIRPVPMQVADRTGSAVINAYFHLLIRYGDQSEVLSFDDLIAIEEYGSIQDFEVRLRNLEYDLTSTIKRVVFGFQSIDAVLAALEEPAQLTLYITEDTLPDVLADVPATIEKVAGEIEAQAGGKFAFRRVDVYGPESDVTPESLFEDYGIQPIASGIFSPDSYYLHMVLQVGDDVQVVYPTGELSETELRTGIESGLKRTSSGFLQTVGIWTPPNTPQQDMFGQPRQPLQQYNNITETLRENYEVRPVDLSAGQVPADIDVLLVINPQGFTDLERYAIDQYLMRGRPVYIAASNYQMTQQFDGSLGLAPVDAGLREMLASYGVNVEEMLVMDPQNEPFPTQVTRDVGGIAVTEIQAIDYPYFVDVRAEGMADHPIVANLPAVTMNWVSPITLDEDKNEDRTVTRLLRSTERAWTSTDLNIQPPPGGFTPTGERQAHTLAVAVEGQFESFFKGQEPPLDLLEQQQQPGAEATQEPNLLGALGQADESPETARLVVTGSAEFLNDNVLRISQSFAGDRFLNSLQLVQNGVDWFVEDTELATIRAQSASARVLRPMDETATNNWEFFNYTLAIASLVGIGIIWRLGKRAEQPMELLPPADAA